jgi:DNA polymerase IIIc chi subunit
MNDPPAEAPTDPTAMAPADRTAETPSDRTAEEPADPLADATAELYRLDPDEFMPRRQDLAARAREAGQPAVAKQIAALRKPTRSAWVVNRLVRTEPGTTQRLTALAAELRDAERAMDGARIRELSAARRRLVDDLTAQALSVLAAPPAALREEVMATFDSALANPEIAASLGTLVRAAHWAGFGLAPAPGDAPPAASPSPAPAKPKTPIPAEAGAERERRRREKIQLAERAVVEATEAADAASVAEQALEDTVRRLETELAEARQRLVEARRQSYRAESRRRRAAGELGRLSE